MKKAIVLFLTLILILPAAVGCAGEQPAQTVTDTDAVTVAVTTAAETEAETTEAVTTEPETTEPETTEEDTTPVTFEEFVIEPEENTELTVTHTYGDHMVIQRDVKFTVWGWSNREGAKVRGLFMDDEARGVVADGKWEMTFSAKEATAEPQTLVIDDSCGNSITITDILVGDVWIIGGQSNAEITMNEIPELITKTTFDETKPVRLFQEGARYVIDNRKLAKEPCEDVINPNWYWRTASKKNAVNSSVLGFYVGTKLTDALGVPVGIISVASSGAKISELMPKELTDKYRYKLGGNVGVNQFYNALTHPFLKMKFKAMVFFQGESEGGGGANPGPKNYARDIEALFDELRSRWGFDFPIYNVQLSDYTEQSASSWTGIGQVRAQQYDAYKSMSGVRLIPSYDLGSDEGHYNYMHSKYKEPLAERIVNLALADLYGIGKADDALAPEPVEVTLSDDKTYVTVKFKNVGEGLVSKSGDNKFGGFAIGLVTKLTPAEAEIISTDTVKVYVPEGAKLSGIGYACIAHIKKGDAQLYNSNDLPALAFYQSLG